MSEIKDKLKDVVANAMIPEVEAYLEDLHILLAEGKQSEDDELAMTEMESLLVELENVLAVIKEDKTEDSEYQRIYDYISENLESKEQ